ncbi:lipopolysaccharide heptosyltransferase II [Candidatus Aerophobetes bacterium]|uniref:lipopolysaccharide heptosyltransferase II n=1 Tax=Aerophobetes bacterium TaxID=2030807 RepID=A0A2A4YLS3_UNCAE|nr:MAG: lipopolysaccharide heptosyltransferase II [Candidatus Aerophobetes bacterium]
MKDLGALEPKKILLRMPNWVGDLVMATPVIEDIKTRYPDSELTVMCKSPISEILKHDPLIDELFTFKKLSTSVRRLQNRNIIRKLHTGKYDLGILLTNSLSSAWWVWQADIPYRLGYTGHFRSSLLTHRMDFSENKQTQHLVLTYKQLLRPLGIEPSDTLPRLVVTEEEKLATKSLLKRFNITDDHTIIGINPGAAYGSAKCWLPERFRDLALRLLDYDEKVRVIFFGDHNGAELVKKITKNLPSRVVNFAGLTTLRELMSLIQACDSFLTNDSGPMHIADALGVPLLALFGSTNDIATGPFLQKNILKKDVECSPCYKRVCPIDFRCMTRIQTDEVFERLLQTIKQKSHV